MPHGPQRFHGFFRHAGLQLHVTALRACLGEARGLQRRLRVHAVVGHVGDELRVGQRLVGAAHDAEGHHRAVFFQKSGDNCVKTPFAGLQFIGMSGRQDKIAAAVLQQKSGSFRRNSGAPRRADALNPAHDVALRVGHCQVSGVRLARFPGFRRALGLFPIDLRGPLFRIVLREKPRERHARLPGIGVVGHQIRVGELH